MKRIPTWKQLEGSESVKKCRANETWWWILDRLRNHGSIRDSFGQDSFNDSHYRLSKSRRFYYYVAFGWLRVHRQQEHVIEPFVYIAWSFIGTRFMCLRAAGTNHIPTQWLLFWWSITAQWPVHDYVWCQALCFEKHRTRPMFTWSRTLQFCVQQML